MRDREQRNCSRRHLPPLKSARGPNSALQICIASKTRIQSEKWISLSFAGLSGSISNHKNENRRSRLRASGGTRAQSGPLSRACRHGRFANRRAVPGKSLGRWGGGGGGGGRRGVPPPPPPRPFPPRIPPMPPSKIRAIPGDTIPERSTEAREEEEEVGGREGGRGDGNGREQRAGTEGGGGGRRRRRRRREGWGRGWGGERGRRGPKGLTRALKIENSKWPIFPADGTETKSRPAFIMTCIAVRATVICTVSLQNATWVSANAGSGNGSGASARVCVYACVSMYRNSHSRSAGLVPFRGTEG
jgi:hypothetical protein